MQGLKDPGVLGQDVWCIRELEMMLGEEAESMLWWDGSTGECQLLCGTSPGLKDWVGPPVSEGMTSDGQALSHLCFWCLYQR